MRPPFPISPNYESSSNYHPYCLHYCRSLPISLPTFTYADSEMLSTLWSLSSFRNSDMIMLPFCLKFSMASHCSQHKEQNGQFDKRALIVLPILVPTHRHSFVNTPISHKLMYNFSVIPMKILIEYFGKNMVKITHVSIEQ